ncbi:MAG: divalent metal cation transporter [Actinobacteria bacterium]|nr:divalent metal cation transporter [Actinomycetota bacterium]
MRKRVAIFLAILGPGLIAGLSDDDPAGITTYAVMGADHGYALLWVLVVATGMLVLYHLLGVRIGVATGQGMIGLVRERYGVRIGGAILVCLLVANLGTLAAEYAGIAAALGMVGIPRELSVPAAAIIITLLVIRSSFHLVERVLLALGALLASYILAGLLAHPDYGATLHGLMVPGTSGNTGALITAVAVVGTTIAPWGLSFIQSYAVDKRIKAEQLKAENVDIVSGAVLTGAIGLFVVVACAATLHATGTSIENAADAAIALEPLAGNLAGTLFGVGLLAAGTLAAAVVPLSTGYSVSEAVGMEARIDDSFREAPLFYGTFVVMTALAALIVALPFIPLLPILFLSQVLNAILLVPILIALARVGGDGRVMGSLKVGRLQKWLLWAGAIGLGITSAVLIATLLLDLIP